MIILFKIVSSHNKINNLTIAMIYQYNKKVFRSVQPLIYILISLSILMGACQGERKKPDVSDVDVEFDWVRYDSLFFGMDSSDIKNTYPELKSAYPAFTQLFIKQILRLRDTSPQIEALVSNEMLQSLYDSVSYHYSEMEEIQAEYKNALKYYAYYFPEYDIPDVYTCITEFSVASFVFLDEEGKDALGISLDMYLGSGFPYERLGKGVSTFSQYLTRTFNKDHMVKKTMHALVQDKAGAPHDNRLIDQMIHNGKQLYLLEQLMPELADTLLFEYTPTQLEWCRSNEAQIWSFLIDKDLLYSRKMSEISTLIGPAPSSMGMPPESPGRTANFVGYRIVKTYMDRTGLSLRALLMEKDAQKILTESRYKGR
jgi:hypothetical protein